MERIHDAREVDWLAVAIGNIGDIPTAAKKLKVTEDTIIRWLERGLGKVRWDRVVRLSELSGIGFEQLRTGPFNY